MGIKPTYPGVYVEESPSGSHPIPGVSTSATGFVGIARQGLFGQPVRVLSFADFQRIFGGLEANAELGYSVMQFFLNGGSDAWVVRVNDLGEIASAVTTFDEVDQLGLLCIPGSVDPAGLQAAITYCDQRRTFFIVDPPSGDLKIAQDLATTMRGSGTSNAAMYFPPITVADPLSGGSARVSAPGGSVAGMIARTDMGQGVWAAPAGAGAHLIGALGVEPTIDDATSQSLAAAGINPIRSIPHAGVVVWSAHTTAVSEQWKYVPVRRLAIYIEASLISGLQWAVFEPNDQLLWVQMCNLVTAFLSELWKRGAFKGSTGDEAFLVKCGLEVMTKSDIDEGRAALLVGFAPVMPREMVMLKVTVQLSSR